VTTAAEDVGWEVRHSENLREHYALTLAAWCRNLVRHWPDCVAEVGLGTARVWGCTWPAPAGFRTEPGAAAPAARRPVGRPRGGRVPLRPWWGTG
jgi:cyclopropane-fatty-acyl-phospholipid synthase